jgi:hypothetical protein
MNDSAASKTTTKFLPLMLVAFFLVVLAWTMLPSFHHSNSPNDAIGRFQMRVTDSGTIIVMDTVTGTVSNISKIEDYSVGGKTFADKSPVKPNPATPVR